MWDTNAFLGHWPFRHLACTDASGLAQALRAQQFTRAFVSPLEALFYGDPQPANRRCAQELKQFQGDDFFRFVATINPALPGCRQAVVRCRDEWDAVGLRLHPNYHNYQLADASVDRFMELAAAAGLPVFVTLRMQDRRAMHPLAPIPDVPLKDVINLCRRHPQNRIILAGAKWLEFHEIMPLLHDLPLVMLETSHMEFVDSVARLVAQSGAARLLLGTQAPIFVAAAARLKLEKAMLSQADRYAIAEGNARSIW